MGAYFGVIDPTRERFPTTPVPSDPDSPVSRSIGTSQSRLVVYEDDETGINGSSRTTFEHSPTINTSTTSNPSESTLGSPLQPGSIRNSQRRNIRTRFTEHRTPLTHHEHIHHRPHHRRKHIPSHGPLLPLILDGPNSSQPAVGLYESIRYVGVERKLAHPAGICNTERFHRLLRECCDDMLEVADETLVALDGWLNSVTNKSRFKFWRDKEECKKRNQGKLDELVQLKEKVDRLLEVFEKEKRCVGLVSRSHCFAG